MLLPELYYYMDIHHCFYSPIPKLSTNWQCYNQNMNILLTAVLMVVFSPVSTPHISAEHILFQFSSIGELTAFSQIQNGVFNQSSAERTPRQEPRAIGSPTRVWRYVIIGSAIAILALIGVISSFRLKRYFAGRNTLSL